MSGDEAVVIDPDGLDALMHELRAQGYETIGPVVRDGAIFPGALGGISDLPRGVGDEQAPGRYRLVETGRETLFSWAVGPGSYKSHFFPARERLAGGPPDRSTPPEPAPAPARPVAIVGARPCELAALATLDGVLAGASTADPGYTARRRGAVVVAVECGSPAATCFCTSMGTGPAADSGADLVLTELDDGEGHRFVARALTPAGAELLATVESRPAEPGDLAARDRVLRTSEASISRHLETEGLRELLVANLASSRWEEVAARCLACGNCTLVCPTCFCSDIRDTTDLSGAWQRERTWASCFDLDHSYLHGGAVRASVSSRYRQWLTHKLSTWWDQFDRSGCVGCGRCIAWCPVGIDLTEEAAAIRALAGSRGTP